MKRSWVIDVCKTCGRLAHWPFCEHGGGLRRPGDKLPPAGWCEPVTVRETIDREKRRR